MLEIIKNLESKWRGPKREGWRQGMALGFRERTKRCPFTPARSPLAEHTHGWRSQETPQRHDDFFSPYCARSTSERLWKPTIIAVCPK